MCSFLIRTLVGSYTQHVLSGCKAVTGAHPAARMIGKNDYLFTWFQFTQPRIGFLLAGRGNGVIRHN